MDIEIKRYIDSKIDYELKNMNYLQQKDIETLLYNYNKYKDMIKCIDKQIETVEENYNFVGGLCNDSERIDHGFNYDSDYDKKEKKLEMLQNKKNKLLYIVDTIDNGVNIISGNKYSDIITLKYFEKMKTSDILERLDISKRTFIRYKKSLINELKSLIIIS